MADNKRFFGITVLADFVLSEGIEPESAKTILVDELVNAPFKVEVPAPKAVPPQSPKPQPAADSSTAGPME